MSLLLYILSVFCFLCSCDNNNCTQLTTTSCIINRTEPLSSNQQTIRCSQDLKQCIVNCIDDYSCGSGSSSVEIIFPNNGSLCRVNCLGKNSCDKLIINQTNCTKVEITIHDTNRYMDIYAGSGELQITLNSDNSKWEQSNVYSQSQYSMILIECLQHICERNTINVSTAIYGNLTYKCDANAQECKEDTIYCPYNPQTSSKQQCNIICDLCMGLEVYTERGTVDVDWQCLDDKDACNSGIIHCALGQSYWTWDNSIGWYLDGEDCIITHSPSTNPSVNPTNEPSLYPSLYPTIYPSFTPTGEPTFEPTVEPTRNPTTLPTTTYPTTASPTTSVSPSSSPSESTTTTTTYLRHTTTYHQNTKVSQTHNPTNNNLSVSLTSTIETTTNSFTNQSVSGEPGGKTIDNLQDTMMRPVFFVSIAIVCFLCALTILMLILYSNYHSKDYNDAFINVMFVHEQQKRLEEQEREKQKQKQKELEKENQENAQMSQEKDEKQTQSTIHSFDDDVKNSEEDGVNSSTANTSNHESKSNTKSSSSSSNSSDRSIGGASVVIKYEENEIVNIESSHYDRMNED